MPKLVKTPTASYNPFFGCAIMIIMLITFGGIISWVVYSLLKQDKDISQFTIDQPPAFVAINADDAAKSALQGRLNAFADAANKGQAAKLDLTIPDLNTLLLLASDAHLGENDGGTPYRDIFRFVAFDPATKTVKTDIHMPMNKLPWQAGKRYIVGEAFFKPLIENNAFDIKLENINVPGKTVNEGLMLNLRTMPWLNVAKLKPEISNALGKVTSFEFSPDGKTLTLVAGSK